MRRDGLYPAYAAGQVPEDKASAGQLRWTQGSGRVEEMGRSQIQTLEFLLIVISLKRSEKGPPVVSS